MLNKDELDSSIKKQEERILKEYGYLLTLEDIAEIFKYKSVSAVRKAYVRGTLPVALYKFNNRSGFYAKPEEVARSIESLILVKPVHSCPINDLVEEGL